MKLALRNDDRKLREAFYLTKKYSSYTWHAEIARQWKTFVDAYERDFLRHPIAGYEPDAWDEENLRIFWSYQTQVEGGLAELLKGNKSLGNELLNQACRFDDWLWSRRFQEIDLSSLGHRFGNGELSTGIFAYAQRAIMMSILNSIHRHLDSLRRDTVSLPNKSRDRDNIILIALGIPFGVPTHELEPFPSPDLNVPAVESGTEAPIMGIWAVEEIESRKGETYCICYPSAGYVMPMMVSEREYELNTRFERTDDESARRLYNKIKPYPVRWRLIWRDTRYEDGTIPPEEAEYLAVNPATDPTQRLRCKAGCPCPLDGYWSTPARANSRRHFQSGDLMPEFTSDYGETIWTFDADHISRT